MNKKTIKPTRCRLNILRQICNLIPETEQSPGFAAGNWRGPAFRFKLPIHVIDSTTMELVANCLDWAKHRRRKAAAKTHLRLNLQSLLPGFALVDTAAEHDNLRARELCADLKSGEIALFDKGYVDFDHLRDLEERGIFWVTRAKENMAYEVVLEHQHANATIFPLWEDCAFF